MTLPSSRMTAAQPRRDLARARRLADRHLGADVDADRPELSAFPLEVHRALVELDGKVDALLLDRLLRDQRLLEVGARGPAGQQRVRPLPVGGGHGRAVLADLPAVLHGLEQEEPVEREQAHEAQGHGRHDARIGLAEIAPTGAAPLAWLPFGPRKTPPLAGSGLGPGSVTPVGVRQRWAASP